MALKQENPRDIFEDLQRQIDGLQLRIERLENASAPTIPVYDPDNMPPFAIEGQIAIAPAT